MSPTPCTNHPLQEAVAPCSHCGRPYCPACLVELVGRRLCADCKEAMLSQVLATRRRHPNALASLIVPIVGWMTCVLLPLTSGLGLWLGWRALRDIRAEPRYTGRTLALAGMVVSGATLVNWLLALIAVVLFRITQ